KVINEGWACAVMHSLVPTDRGFLRIGDVVNNHLPVKVSDGTTLRRVYDWAKFEDRETIFIRTRRGLELEGSVTHRLMLPDGNWRRLDELQGGDCIVLGGGGNVWATELVPITWQPQSR